MDRGQGCGRNGSLLHKGMVVAVELGGLAGEARLGPTGNVVAHVMPNESVTHEALSGAHLRVRQAVKDVGGTASDAWEAGQGEAYLRRCHTAQ